MLTICCGQRSEVSVLSRMSTGTTVLTFRDCMQKNLWIRCVQNVRSPEVMRVLITTGMYGPYIFRLVDLGLAFSWDSVGALTWSRGLNVLIVVQFYDIVLQSTEIYSFNKKPILQTRPCLYQQELRFSYP